MEVKVQENPRHPSMEARHTQTETATDNRLDMQSMPYHVSKNISEAKAQMGEGEQTRK